jgi:hypothetical protein
MAHAEHTADDQYEATPPGAEYEHTDANVWLIAKFVFWLAVAAVVIHVALAFLFGLFVQQRVQEAEPRYPLAAREADREPPRPRLQRFPRQDIMELRLAEEARLRQYGKDEKTGTIHIPIDDAMKLTLQRGLPARSQDAARPPIAAGQMPADSSAGRPLEQRRQ